MRALVLALVLTGCSSGAEPVSAEPREPDLPEPTEPASGVDGPPLDPHSECGRALACCEAYADAIENVVASSACVGPREASTAPDAGERCERMRDGWREALEHHPRAEVPEVCR